MNNRPSWRERVRSLGLPTLSGQAAERRQIETSGLFDPAWYSTQVAPEVRGEAFDPLYHYITLGRAAGHAPGQGFDPTWYLHRYSDVATSGLDPLIHYIRFGRRQGRLPKPPAKSLFDDFQSLGWNCEFGVVQRHFGCEMLSLFGFASTSVRGLLKLLLADTDPFQSPEAMQIVVANDGEYMVSHETYGFLFHTYLHHEALAAGRVRDNELQRLRYLWRKFTEDLREGGRIFVFKPHAIIQPKRAAKLAAFLRRTARNHLLWVTLADEEEPPGTVKLIGPGLMRGTLDRIPHDPAEASFDVWGEICQRAHDLWSCER
jgi:hypothetical protein